MPAASAAATSQSLSPTPADEPGCDTGGHHTSPRQSPPQQPPPLPAADPSPAQLLAAAAHSASGTTAAPPAPAKPAVEESSTTSASDTNRSLFVSASAPVGAPTSPLKTRAAAPPAAGAGGAAGAGTATEEDLAVPSDEQEPAELDMDDEPMQQRVPRGRRQSGSLTYATVIALAIDSSEEGRLPLPMIYRYFQNHPGAADMLRRPNWRHSVRHILTRQACFVKVRCNGEPALEQEKYCLWALVESKMPPQTRETLRAARRARAEGRPVSHLLSAGQDATVTPASGSSSRVSPAPSSPPTPATSAAATAAAAAAAASAAALALAGMSDAATLTTSQAEAASRQPQTQHQQHHQQQQPSSMPSTSSKSEDLSRFSQASALPNTLYGGSLLSSVGAPYYQPPGSIPHQQPMSMSHGVHGGSSFSLPFVSAGSAISTSHISTAAVATPSLVGATHTFTANPAGSYFGRPPSSEELVPMLSDPMVAARILASLMHFGVGPQEASQVLYSFQRAFASPSLFQQAPAAHRAMFQYILLALQADWAQMQSLGRGPAHHMHNLPYSAPMGFQSSSAQLQQQNPLHLQQYLQYAHYQLQQQQQQQQQHFLTSTMSSAASSAASSQAAAPIWPADSTADAASATAAVLASLRTAGLPLAAVTPTTAASAAETAAATLANSSASGLLQLATAASTTSSPTSA